MSTKYGLVAWRLTSDMAAMHSMAHRRASIGTPARSSFSLSRSLHLANTPLSLPLLVWNTAASARPRRRRKEAPCLREMSATRASTSGS